MAHFSLHSIVYFLPFNVYLDFPYQPTSPRTSPLQLPCLVHSVHRPLVMHSSIAPQCTLSASFFFYCGCHHNIVIFPCYPSSCTQAIQLASFCLDRALAHVCLVLV